MCDKLNILFWPLAQTPACHAACPKGPRTPKCSSAAIYTVITFYPSLGQGVWARVQPARTHPGRVVLVGSVAPVHHLQRPLIADQARHRVPLHLQMGNQQQPETTDSGDSDAGFSPTQPPTQSVYCRSCSEAPPQEKTEYGRKSSCSVAGSPQTIEQHNPHIYFAPYTVVQAVPWKPNARGGAVNHISLSAKGTGEAHESSVTVGHCC